jgi:hypothetical protein
LFGGVNDVATAKLLAGAEAKLLAGHTHHIYILTESQRLLKETNKASRVL